MAAITQQKVCINDSVYPAGDFIDVFKKMLLIILKININ